MIIDTAIEIESGLTVVPDEISDLLSYGASATYIPPSISNAQIESDRLKLSGAGYNKESAERFAAIYSTPEMIILPMTGVHDANRLRHELHHRGYYRLREAKKSSFAGAHKNVANIYGLARLDAFNVGLGYPFEFFAHLFATLPTLAQYMPDFREIVRESSPEAFCIQRELEEASIEESLRMLEKVRKVFGK